MKIAVATTMQPGIYSGGRYLAQILAHALNRAGADVVYLSNNDALFDADFASYDLDRPLRKIIGSEYALPEGFAPDWVVVIPTGGFDQKFYVKALDMAHAHGARVALLSFETPNWFNGMSPFSRSAMPTESWRQIVSRGGAVITIAEEGIPHARAYFGADRTDLHYAAWHPPINDRVAATARPFQDDRKRVMMFTRTEDPHKGAQDLLKIDPAVLEGYTLSLVFGRKVNAAFTEALARHFGTEHGIEIELHDRITDAEKFNLIASSELLLFPSYFEGFGYPPVEAAYMGVPSVAYDLPLLRESVAQAARYVTPGDTAAFSRAIAETLAERPSPDEVRAGMAIAPDTLTAGTRFVEILQHAARYVPVQTTPPANINVPADWPTIVDPTAQNIMRALGGDLQINEFRACLSGNRLTLSGRFTGKTDHRRLRFQFGTVEFQDIRLGQQDNATGTFEVTGRVYSWPSDTLVQIGKVMIIERGGEMREKMRFQITPTAEILLERRYAQDGRQAARHARAGRAHFLLRENFLFTDPRNALCLSALVRTCDTLSVDSTLCLPDGGGCVSLGTEPDFMPLVTRVLRQTAGELARDGLAEALEDDGIAIIETALLEEGAVDLPEGAQAVALGAHNALTFVGTQSDLADRVAAISQTLTPAVLHAARRSVAQRLRGSVLVLCPSGPVAQLPEDLRSLLAVLNVSLPALEVLMPRRLCDDPFLKKMSFGGTGGVTICTEIDLMKKCREARRLAVLAWPTDPGMQVSSDTKTRDMPMQGLLEAAPAGTWIDAGPFPQRTEADTGTGKDALTDLQERLDAALLPEDDSPLRDALAPLFPQAPLPGDRHGRIRLHTGRLPPQMEARAAPLPPLFTRTHILSFASPRTDSRSALYAGWGSMTEAGPVLKNGVGVICFRVPLAERREGTRLETLVMLTDISGPTTLSLHLNGHPVGHLTAATPGYYTLQAELVPEHWAGREDTLQYLAVHCSEMKKSVVLAVSLSDPRPEEPDWALMMPETDAQAPLRHALPMHFSFRDRQTPKGLLLRAGWYPVEETGCWSGGDHPVLGFQGPIEAHSPMILHVRGKPFLPPSEKMQTVGFSFGISRFAETRLDRHESAVTAIALPQAAREHGIDTLFLDYGYTASPKSLGISEDTRTLGFFFEEVTLAHTASAATEIALDARQRAFDGATVTLPAAAGVLRLSGLGTLPEGMAFGFRDAPALALPQAMAEGGWEAHLALPPDLQAAQDPALVALSLTDTGHVAALPEIDRLTFWPGEDLAETPCKITLVHSAGPSTAADSQGRLHRPGVGIDFSLPSQAYGVLGRGWSSPEDNFVWSDGEQVGLNMAADSAHHSFAVLTAGAFLARGDHPQRFGLTLGGTTRIATFTATNGDTRRYLAALPPTDQTPRTPGFDLPDAISPHALGMHGDRRKLAMRLHAFHTEPAGRPDLRVVTDWAEGVTDCGLTLVANSPVGAILRITGHGHGPYGLRIAGREAVVVHPLTGPVSGMWFADLALDDQTPGQQWHLQEVSEAPPAADGLSLSQGRLCTFHLEPQEGSA